MEQAVIWILGIIAFIILEAVTYQLVSIWFAIGALGGMIAAFLGTNFYVQMAVFIVESNPETEGWSYFFLLFFIALGVWNIAHYGILLGRTNVAEYNKK